MLYVTLERTIRRPPPLVWRFVTDLANAPSWVDELVEIHVIDTPLTPGTTLSLQRRTPPGQRVQRMLCDVTALRAPTGDTPGILALEARLKGERWAGGLLFTRLVLARVPEGSRLTLTAELHDTSGSTIFTRAPGLEAPSPTELALRAGYERSAEALATRVEREGDAPYR